MGDAPHDPLVAYEDDPATNRVHHPYTAFNQGWDAYDAGHARDRCPYPPAGRLEYWWLMGWDDAQDEKYGETDRLLGRLRESEGADAT